MSLLEILTVAVSLAWWQVVLLLDRSRFIASPCFTVFIPAGQHVAPCNVIPKDQYIEAGSDTVVMCQTLCFPGKVYWTLNNRPIDDSLSKAINSSHTVLTLRNFTRHNATLQCHNADTQQILGGVFITTYSKKYI